MSTEPSDPAAPLFSQEVRLEVVERVREALAAIGQGEGDDPPPAMSPGLTRVAASVATSAALGSPGIRREVQRIATAAYAKGQAGAFTDDHEVCETDRARLAASLEAAERERDQARDAAAYWMGEDDRHRRALGNIVEADGFLGRGEDTNRRYRARVAAAARAALSGDGEPG